MDHLRHFLGVCCLLVALGAQAQQEPADMTYVGRFLDDWGCHALVAQCENAAQWHGDAYFRASLILVNTCRQKEKRITSAPTYVLNALFTDARHFLYTDGNRIYRCRVNSCFKPRCLYTVRDTQRMLVLDMVRYGDETYLVVEDYAERKLVNPRWPEDDDSYESALRIIELKTGTEIARMGYPFSGSSRYTCIEKKEGWVFQVMDTTFAMDAPRHLQEVQWQKGPKASAQRESEWHSVRIDPDRPKEVHILRNR
ncbi:MAG: hypothetical protein J5873_05305 [Bacteroidales bacterium]|nr:hypothetical protein [Bacteroidales bacterium]